ncbi:unnamed protein product [Clonostachys rosea]|uniref:Uncharacterized protein n=1 Tax=Bionectria ochroleuca TaxID=29856 RepID=A0ABY6UAJ5_BIOOC|nr:unnamed protein product [Clonostachys rosea]
MHFLNVLVSIFAVTSAVQALDLREFEETRNDMLEARQEYIEKRALFRRLGGPRFCKGDKKPLGCYEAVPGPHDHAQQWRKVGTCSSKAKVGSPC